MEERTSSTGREPVEELGRGEVWWPPDWRAEPPEASVDVLIPALNEAENIPAVLREIPEDWVRRVVVVDNGSTDATAERAREGGAEVVDEPNRGYGTACLAGLEYMAQNPPDVVAFMDADRSDVPGQLPRVVAPVTSREEIDLSVGSRTIGAREAAALPPQSRFGNRLACALMELLYGYRFTDLGPFRAIRWRALERLQMRDPDYGWTVEMQIKAAREKLRAVEVPVAYRRRTAGESKVSGTVKGSLLAGYKILWTIFSEYTSS